MTEYAIGVDLADLYSTPDGGAPARTLAWGDRVEVLEGKAGHLKLSLIHI